MPDLRSSNLRRAKNTVPGLINQGPVSNGFTGFDKGMSALLRVKRVNTLGQSKQQRNGRLPAALSQASTSLAAQAPAPGSGQPKAMLEGAGMYVHLPFCKSQCHYCDFPIKVATRNPSRWEHHLDTYFNALFSELNALIGCSPPLEDSLCTVNFGGGTPSLVPPERIEELLHSLDASLGIRSDAEIGIEADPGTFDLHTLEQYRHLGITRISLGVQCFDDTMLRAIGRSHSLADVHRAIDAVHASGLEWNLDLMSSLPHLTEENWEHILATALDAAPHHLSLYELQVEEGTAFSRWYTPGEPPLPSHEESERMYKYASHRLQRSGYKHYEISNYCKPGKECAHNLRYWCNGDWLALGMGAVSSISGARLTRPSTFEEYVEWATSLCRGDSRLHQQLPSEEDVLLDEVMLKLRLADGLDLKRFAERFSEDMARRVERALLPFEREHKARLRRNESGVAVEAALTAPDGFIVSNDAISDCFIELTDFSS